MASSHGVGGGSWGLNRWTDREEGGLVTVGGQKRGLGVRGWGKSGGSTLGVSSTSKNCPLHHRYISISLVNSLS